MWLHNKQQYAPNENTQSLGAWGLCVEDFGCSVGKPNTGMRISWGGFPHVFFVGIALVKGKAVSFQNTFAAS